MEQPAPAAEPNPYPRRKWIEYGALPAAILFWTAVFIFGPVGYRERGRVRSRCASNLKQIGYACQLYAGDNDEAFPADLGALYPDYISDAEIFICPKSRAPVEECADPWPGAITDENLSFCYVSGLTAADNFSRVLAFEEEWNHGGDGVLALTVGGLVYWMSDIGAFHRDLERRMTVLEKVGRSARIIRPSWSTWPAKPPWLVPDRSRLAWIGFGIGAGVVLAAAAVTLFIFRRRQAARAQEGA